MASPLRGRYAPMLAIALFALVPYILVASGATLYQDQVIADLGTTRGAISVIQGLSVAGYAFGALLGGDLVNRFVQRRLFYVCEAVFIAGWLLVAAAHGIAAYGAGRVLSGLATGMLLVTALPPVVRRFPATRLPLTAAFINLAFFGAIAAGPLLGGAIAAGHLWRALYVAFAVLGALTFLTALASLPKIEPFNPDLPIDLTGLGLGFAATALPFWATGELASNGFGTLAVLAPLVVGLASFVALLLVEYHKSEPLAPVKMMWTTFPVIGTLIAMIGGGTFVTFVELTTQFLLKVAHATPLATGLSFWPQVVGVLITAAVLGLVFPTRYLSLLVYGGMLALIAAGALLVRFDTAKAPAHLLAAVGLLGLGAGATVSPGLFLAGLALPTQMLGRIFALVELVRSVADFILAPVMMRVATTASASTGAEVDAAGLHRAMGITVLIAIAGTIVVVMLHVLGRAGLPRPSLEAWVKQNRPAIPSPHLAQAVRTT